MDTVSGSTFEPGNLPRERGAKLTSEIPNNRYWPFIKQNARFVSFGFALTFFSGFGQTYFISLFSGEFRRVFELSHGGFGTVYSLATLTSAVTLVWLGRKLDSTDLRTFTLGVCLGLAAAAVLTGLTPSVFVLYLAIFLLRLTGQGLLSHTALTSMGRYFHKNRGKAVTLAALGHPTSEAVFPSIAVALTAVLTWRETWFAIAGIVVVVLLPIVFWGLKGHATRHERHVEDMTERDRKAHEHETPRRDWTRGSVLKDGGFYLLLPTVVAPAFINTGVFFHQVHLVNVKGWELSLFAAAYVVFAIGTITASVLAGRLVDRFSATSLFPYHLLPLGLVLPLLAAVNDPAISYVYMFGAGLSQGAGVTIKGSLWAELYGVTHLGAIRSMLTSIMVFSTALSPALLGWLFDGGVSFFAVLVGLCLYVVAGTVVSGFELVMKRAAV